MTVRGGNPDEMESRKKPSLKRGKPVLHSPEKPVVVVHRRPEDGQDQAKTTLVSVSSVSTVGVSLGGLVRRCYRFDWRRQRHSNVFPFSRFESKVMHYFISMDIHQIRVAYRPRGAKTCHLKISVQYFSVYCCNACPYAAVFHINTKLSTIPNLKTNPSSRYPENAFVTPCVSRQRYPK